MTTNVIPMFTFENQQLRGVLIDGQPWFAATDACRILGFNLAGGTSPHLRKLSPDEKGKYKFLTHGGEQALSTVSRPGLFKLIQRSNKPEAKKFDRWVRHEVLPQIMDNGGYMMADADQQAVLNVELRRGCRRQMTAQGFRSWTYPRLLWFLSVSVSEGQNLLL